MLDRTVGGMVHEGVSQAHAPSRDRRGGETTCDLVPLGSRRSKRGGDADKFSRAASKKRSLACARIARSRSVSIPAMVNRQIAASCSKTSAPPPARDHAGGSWLPAGLRRGRRLKHSRSTTGQRYRRALICAFETPRLEDRQLWKLYPAHQAETSFVARRTNSSP